MSISCIFSYKSWFHNPISLTLLLLFQTPTSVSFPTIQVLSVNLYCTAESQWREAKFLPLSSEGQREDSRNIPEPCRDFTFFFSNPSHISKGGHCIFSEVSKSVSFRDMRNKLNFKGKIEGFRVNILSPSHIYVTQYFY